MFKLILKYNLIWVLIIIMLIPGCLLGLSFASKNLALPEWMGSKYNLNGMTKIIESVNLDWKHFASHDAQNYLSESISSQLPLRSWFIMLNNQMYYSIFKKSYAENSLIIIGNKKQLFSRDYIDAYCDAPNAPFNNLITLEQWADNLKKLNDYFVSKGKVFVYLITPSKAEYMPDSIPARFGCKNSGVSQHIKNMVRLLEDRKVPYVNGAELMMNAEKKYQIPMFARGGIHWNWLGSSVTANALIKAINNQNRFHLQTIPMQFHVAKGTRFTTDADLQTLLNLLRPNFNYSAPQFDTQASSQSSNNLHAVFIGGSFLGHLMHLYSKNNTFHFFSHYGYFKLARTDYESGKEAITDSNIDVNSKQTLNNIQSANVIVLEENSSRTVSAHGALFYETMNKVMNDRKG